jgi:signal transduction histidine kinase
MGLPTDAETFLELEVPLPFWRAPWFWVAICALALSGLFAGYRYQNWRRLQMENLRLTQLQTLERERLRIARDIHDDLGAQVTQISLASALAARTAADAKASREGFERITQLSRGLVASLYDTIWVVNPDNDNLEAVGNYLCQVFNQLLSQAGVSCRLNVPALPAAATITSHQRHNLSMAVKEAAHNIIKHAGASEAWLNITLDDSQLHISVQDNGVGFDPESVQTGSGLGNLKHRLEEIGGSAKVTSRRGGGTVVHLRMPVRWEGRARASRSSPVVG